MGDDKPESQRPGAGTETPDPPAERDRFAAAYASKAVVDIIESGRSVLAATLKGLGISRSVIGLVLGTVGIALIFQVLSYEQKGALEFIQAVGDSFKDKELLALTAILAHAAVLVAIVVFGYALLKMAERMLLPLDLAEKAVHLLVGGGKPAADLPEAVDAVKNIAATLKPGGDE